MIKILTHKNFLRLRIFQPNMSLLNRVLGVLLCLHAHVLTYRHARMLGMAKCLACLRAIAFGVFTCYVFICLACLLVLCPYLTKCFTCLLCSNALHAYVLPYFFAIVCPIFFAFEKLTSKNPYIEKFLFIQRSI